MTSSPRADAFADALHTLERTGDTDALVALFSKSAQLRRPELEHARVGSTDVQDFWRGYLSPFSEVRTEFLRIAETDDLAVLEWESQGELRAGRDLTYRGVSLLSYDANGHVEDFATYFDTAAFLPPPDAAGDH